MATQAQDGFGRWPVRRELPVQWGDMDAFAHVNNTVYLRWFETVRIAYFEELDVPRTPQDRGWLWLLDDRYAQPAVARLLPPAWGLATADPSCVQPA